MPTLTTEEDKIILLNKLLEIFSKLPEQIYSDLILNLHSIILEITAQIEIRSDIIDSIKNLKECEGRDVLLEKLNIKLE